MYQIKGEIKVVAGANYGGFKMQEIRAEYLNQNGEERIFHDTVPFSLLKEHAGIKRWDSFKKSEAWLNTDEGKEWFGKKIYEWFQDKKRRYSFLKD